MLLQGYCATLISQHSHLSLPVSAAGRGEREMTFFFDPTAKPAAKEKNNVINDGGRTNKKLSFRDLISF